METVWKLQKKYGLSTADIKKMVDVAYDNGKTLDKVAYEANEVMLALRGKKPREDFEGRIYREFFDSAELDLYDKILGPQK